MTDEVITFFTNRLGPIERIEASFARKGIPPSAIHEACADIYAQHQTTPFVSTVALGQRLFVRSRELREKHLTLARQVRRQRAPDLISPLTARVSSLETLTIALSTRLASLEHRHRPAIDKIIDWLNTIPYYG